MFTSVQLSLIINGSQCAHTCLCYWTHKCIKRITLSCDTKGKMHKTKASHTRTIKVWTIAIASFHNFGSGSWLVLQCITQPSIAHGKGQVDPVRSINTLPPSQLHLAFIPWRMSWSNTRSHQWTQWQSKSQVWGMNPILHQRYGCCVCMTSQSIVVTVAVWRSW